MAKHSPPDDASFALSLARHLGAAVALVAVVAAAFWGIGQVRDDGSSMTVASSPDASDAGADPSPTVAATAEPSDPPTSEPPPADEGTAAPADEATPADDANEAPDEPVATETEEEPAAPAGDLDPADISVQVLDATGGGDAMDEVVDQLEEDGFNIVATNRAVREYEVTTVFYTPGNEAKAQQIADMYGYREVAPEPGNLSHSVDVHLVVGLDA